MRVLGGMRWTVEKPFLLTNTHTCAHAAAGTVLITRDPRQQGARESLCSPEADSSSQMRGVTNYLRVNI